MSDPVHIRQAIPGDAPRIAELSSQLGYPVSAADMSDRVHRLLNSPTHALYVAASGAMVVGWIAGELRLSIETGLRGEITGLVVDASSRRSGVGGSLVAAIEQWAIQNEVQVILVRTNVTRAESRSFYERLGYQQVKTQHSYKRVLHAA